MVCCRRETARQDSLLRIDLRLSDYREGTKAVHGAHREEATHPPLRKGENICEWEGEGDVTGAMVRDGKNTTRSPRPNGRGRYAPAPSLLKPTVTSVID